MKTNIFKNIFFIILILLIILGVYILYKDGKRKVNLVTNNKLSIKTDNNLNIGIVNFDTINPLITTNKNVIYIDKLIFESLIDITKDFKIQNVLSKEFSKINSKTYIVKLDENKYWHDGTKFTAKDVIFTIDNLKNNKDSIYNKNVENIDKLEQIDDYTVKIILKEENAFFKYMMIFPILASHAYDNMFMPTNEIPIGTGKYKIIKIMEEEIVLEKNDLDKSEKIENITIKLYDKANKMYGDFSKKIIDLIITDNILYEEYVGSMGFNIAISKNRIYNYIAINSENSILQNKEIRKAINFSIDKNSINYKVYNSRYLKSENPLDYGNYLFKEENKNNVINAKEVLLQNGWSLKNNYWTKNGKKLSINLVINNEKEENVLIANELKEQLNNIGIELKIYQVNQDLYKNYMQNKNYDMILMETVLPIYPNLEMFFGENNLLNYKNEKITALINQINFIEDENILSKNYKEIIEIYNEEIPFISLFNNPNYILYNENIKGDLSHNWYNVFYNIDTWYKQIEQ